MEIRPIRTKQDYEAALKEIERLMGAKRNSPEGDRLDVLVTLVEAYEAKHFPLDLPDPVAKWGRVHISLAEKVNPAPFIRGIRGWSKKTICPLQA